MTKLTIISSNGIRIHYSLETIENIQHGKARDIYNKSDLEGNGVRPNESLIIISFKDRELATFTSDWTITFE